MPLTRLSVSAEPAGIEAYLADVLGRPVRIGVLLGPPRANIKPVVQIFGDSGETVGFAKLGLTPLTATLLATEADALDLLARRTALSFQAPRPLHHGQWKGTPILVQEALALAQSNQAPVEPPLDVMVEIAGLNGVTVEPLADSAFLRSIEPAAHGDWHNLDLRPLARLFAEVEGADSCPFGSWHGDFGPWNMATDGTRAQVWDWERFAMGVPVGLDAAHYRTQRGVAAQTDPDRAWSQILRDVEAVLRASGADALGAPVVGASYLLAICARYLTDAVDGPTQALSRRMHWLTRVAGAATHTLQERSS